MTTECKTEQLENRQLGRRAAFGRYDGGAISSDGRGLLLREVDKRTGSSEKLARFFRGYRKPERMEQPVRSMVRQRICGIAPVYEDF